MRRDYLIGLAMAAGHDPRDVREYALRDLECLRIVDEATGGDLL